MGQVPSSTGQFDYSKGFKSRDQLVPDVFGHRSREAFRAAHDRRPRI